MDKIVITEEIWKDIEGYEGLYQVSNLGNIKSLKNNSLLKPLKCGYKRSYRCIHLYKNGVVTIRVMVLLVNIYKVN